MKNYSRLEIAKLARRGKFVVQLIARNGRAICSVFDTQFEAWEYADRSCRGGKDEFVVAYINNELYKRA